MDKVKIKIVKLGFQKNNMAIEKLKKYKSPIFNVAVFSQNLPSCDWGWGYSFDTLKNILTNDFDAEKYDMCMGFIDTEIENNYFGKRLDGNNIYVISFYQVAELLDERNIDIFNYILSTLYRYVTRYILKGSYLTHDETRACLFDMCGNKSDIIYSSNKPVICEACEAKIKQNQIPDNYLETLKKELKRIRKANYYVISDFIKKHPYFSIMIGIFTSLAIGLLTNFLYDVLKCLF